MGKRRRICTAAVCAALLITVLAGCGGQGSLGAGDKEDPITITLWHYYNGAQQKVFNEMVQEFNSTVGAEQGILVEAQSYGTVNDLSSKVLDAVYEKVGAEEVPDVFASYADTAYEINSLGKVADLAQYLTEEEQSAYVTAYLDEGRFEDDGGFKIFPIAKSTEVLTVNKTEWDAFAAATGAGESAFATWEGIAALAGQYYLWTDGLTPGVAEDGKAFFGRDAFANYILVGSEQLGAGLFRVSGGKAELSVDETAMRRLWDCYYIPYINGYFSAFGKFRSDDVRTGDLAACVGATSGATYFPTEVTRADGSTYPIEVAVYPLPNFEGTEPMAVQQGAGMVVSKSTPEREKAAVAFLKWFTQPEQNSRFAMSSGYLPVTNAANQSVAALKEQSGEMSAVLYDTLTIGAEMTGEYRLYAGKAFENGSDARVIVNTSMDEKAKKDRAAVKALMDQGISRTEAVARYDTDENFSSWLNGFRAELKNIIK
ncbi:putative lipoprotein [uncultured Eubacteriales bacterium]|uniref:Putative lipoprotein n=1 Tax=uncultured Eubacteriales bacterium TaxID=172733 RepID=A0A212JP21_9FIRM|nr:putative lipoprotein [uncultured Eubacteriales bacterium]